MIKHEKIVVVVLKREQVKEFLRLSLFEGMWCFSIHEMKMASSPGLEKGEGKAKQDI